MRLFAQMERLEEGMERFKAEVKENKDRWKVRLVSMDCNGNHLTCGVPVPSFHFFIIVIIFFFFGDACAQGRSTNFALEEKTRKRFAAQYPKLLSQLVAKLEHYEKAFQEKFRVRGRELMPILQEILAVR